MKMRTENGSTDIDETPLTISQPNRTDGAITFIMVSGMFGLGQATVIAFPAEKPVFIKEYAARTYTASAYFLSKIPVDVGMAFIQCIFMWLIVYWLCKSRETEKRARKS